MKNIALKSFGHAILAAGYILGIVTLISNAQSLFGNQDNKFWIPVSMLMLFVVSATIVGSLVLGRPVLMYMNGQKQESVKFFGYTVAWMVLLTIIAFLILAASK